MDDSRIKVAVVVVALLTVVLSLTVFRKVIGAVQFSFKMLLFLVIVGGVVFLFWTQASQTESPLDSSPEYQTQSASPLRR